MEIVIGIISILVIFSPFVLLLFDFFSFLCNGTRVMHDKWIAFRVLEILMLLIPCIGLIVSDLFLNNSCCGATATLSAEHKGSIYALIALIGITYFYCLARKKIGSPIVEIMLNSLLLTGILLCILIALQVPEQMASLAIGIPVLIQLIFILHKNHRLAVDHTIEWEGGSAITRFCWYILHLRPLAKFPILLVLCLPLVMLLAAILLLFGQKPDALVRAFTDTYKQGFSQLNDQCNGVVCNQGHFLCTIAANGHGSLVRPIRSGIRGGIPIKCNRQLLISNAFEELLEQRMPDFHRIVRNSYNKVGDSLDRYYGLYDHKWISDTIYILMKPLEWIFLLVLYTFDQKPENRIAQQYMSPSDRRLLRQKEKN